jgi:hypothetical protein
VLVLAGGIAWDALAPRFWAHHALLAGLVSSVIVVILTVALVNEAVERRSRRRWAVLAQHVMVQLVCDARLVWTGVAQLAGLMPPGTYTRAAIKAGADAVQDTAGLTAAIRELVADTGRRQRLRDEVAWFARHNDEVLGRWAAVMLSADPYAEVIDRHVELAGELGWLASLLGAAEPPSDRGRTGLGGPDVRMRLLAHPLHSEGDTTDHDRLADRVVAVTQRAEKLDRGTFNLAMRIVPLQWWAARLGVVPPASGTDTRAAAGRR